ncbi:acyl carrier protein [Paenibacillus sp. BR2-3]|uniref:acyl carrier protein n=1 Tax=Paenibacillus sp. BR2-3 TaxID=3048494 RepID=UPI003977353D
MDQPLTFEQFQTIFSEYLGIDTIKLTKDVNLLFELGVDSLSLVNVMLRLEKEYQVAFKAEDRVMTRTLGEAYDLFTKYKSLGGQAQVGN